MTTGESAGSTAALSTGLDQSSQRLVAARLQATPLPDGFPGELPATLDEAYALQSASIGRWPDSVAGWKIGLLSPVDRSRYGAERLAGPIFGSSIFMIDTDGSRCMPIFAGGFAAVEAEFVLKLGQTVEPVAAERSDDEIRDLVDTLHIGAEIASSPMEAVNRLGPMCVISDFGNNAGLIVGPAIADWRRIPAEDLDVAVTVDGKVVGEANAAAIPGGPLGALRFLLAVCADRGIVLPEGCWVSTGATTGIHDVIPASRAYIDFGRCGRFGVSFEPGGGA